MITINNISDTIFELNGIQYLKNYLSRPYGNNIEIYNCYERKDVLVEKSHYTEFTVNGTTYSNTPALQVALLNILFSRNSLNNSTFPDATTVTKGKIQLAGDLSGIAASPTVPALTTKLPIEVPSASGAVISFITDRIYGSTTIPVTGNITINLSEAKLGVTNLIIHNSATVPTLPTALKKLNGSQNYITSVNNYIYMTYLDVNNINYIIQQII